jgi:uncharacterized cupredoxin-like copper-binding protein
MQRLIVLAVLLLISLLVLMGCQPTTAPAPEAVPTEAEEAEEVEEPVTEEMTPTEELTPTDEIAPSEEVTPSEEMTPTEEMTETEAMTETGAVNTVEVELVDGEINMPESLPAGLTEFTVTNNGTEDHNFEIEGQGIEEVFEEDLAPGDSNTLQVELAAGEYEVYCPVGDHRDMGMELALTVTES